MHVVVDNSAGGDPFFAGEVAEGLRARGLEVELREPLQAKEFDTFVHVVSAGLVIRVSEHPDRAVLAVIAEVVRGALMHRPSVRRRARSVPVHLGETGRAIEWIDVFD
ncbi:MAG TPA: hypothetical protein VGJ32_00900 [Solirubrobacteraceae bacterium]